MDPQTVRPKIKYKPGYKPKKPGRKPLKGLALRRSRDLKRTEQRLKIKPKKVRDEIIKQRGLISEVAKALKVPYATLMRYIDKHKDCVDTLAEARSRMGDVAESKLFDRIENGDVRCLLYYLSTVHRNRGYGLSAGDRLYDPGDSNPVFVDTVNIVGIPSGTFLPKEPDPKLIDGTVEN
jgi:hypothetical protein